MHEQWSSLLSRIPQFARVQCIWSIIITAGLDPMKTFKICMYALLCWTLEYIFTESHTQTTFKQGRGAVFSEGGLIKHLPQWSDTLCVFPTVDSLVFHAKIFFQSLHWTMNIMYYNDNSPWNILSFVFKIKIITTYQWNITFSYYILGLH